ncbi:hypothetical protein AGLY_006137 [Aphis glycines]|uniref:Uncharacterized protein n=1 Tax=Aphis glycines TaxID=307491 RepID=A0A6G0TSZ2_APHGL|nr:hypothetical protein AGLY_006137 [Aphis glycines]
MRPQLESHNKCDDNTRLQQGQERAQEGRLEIPVKHNETLWERAQKDVLQSRCLVLNGDNGRYGIVGCTGGGGSPAQQSANAAAGRVLVSRGHGFGGGSRPDPRRGRRRRRPPTTTQPPSSQPAAAAPAPATATPPPTASAAAATANSSRSTRNKRKNFQPRNISYTQDAAEDGGDGGAGGDSAAAGGDSSTAAAVLDLSACTGSTVAKRPRVDDGSAPMDLTCAVPQPASSSRRSRSGRQRRSPSARRAAVAAHGFSTCWGARPRRLATTGTISRTTPLT